MRDTRYEQIQDEWRRAVRSFDCGDFDDALSRFETLANKGVQEAFLELGNIYELGVISGGMDADKAAYWYQRSLESDQESTAAHLGLARVLLNSEDKDLQAMAIHHFELASDEEMGANFALGVAYHIGRGTEVNKFKALRYFQRAAKMGHIAAAVNVEKATVKPGPFRAIREKWAGYKAARRLLRDFPIENRDHDPRFGVRTTKAQKRNVSLTIANPGRSTE